jgi:tRNA 2-thiouridine synthesizing protein A
MAPIGHWGDGILLGRIFCGKPVPTPHQVRGRLFPENAPGKTRMADTVLNLRGLRCPLPALKTRKALRSLAAGDRLVVECTDPLSAIDIPNLLRETGDVLEGDARETGLFVFRIRKSE